MAKSTSTIPEPVELTSIHHFAEWSAAKRILYPYDSITTLPRLQTTFSDTKPYLEVEIGIRNSLEIWKDNSLQHPHPNTLQYPYLTQWRLERFLLDTNLPTTNTNTLYEIIQAKTPYTNTSPEIQNLADQAIANMQRNIDADIALDRLLN